VSDPAARLTTLLDRLARDLPDVRPEPPTPVIDPAEPVLSEFVRSMLLWESTQARAAVAMRRLEAAVVDYNELRVCMPGELVRLIGPEYPRAQERAERLRAALAELFSRAHAVTFRQVQDMGKREVRQYIESLAGVPAFVSSRVALLCLGNHAMPVDSRIQAVLVEAGAAAADDAPEAVASSIERRVRAGDLAAAYVRLQARADELKLVDSLVSEVPPRIRTAPRRESTPVEARPRPSAASPRTRSGRPADQAAGNGSSAPAKPPRRSPDL